MGYDDSSRVGLFTSNYKSRRVLFLPSVGRPRSGIRSIDWSIVVLASAFFVFPLPPSVRLFVFRRCSVCVHPSFCVCAFLSLSLTERSHLLSRSLALSSSLFISLVHSHSISLSLSLFPSFSVARCAEYNARFTSSRTEVHCHSAQVRPRGLPLALRVSSEGIRKALHPGGPPGHGGL